MKKNKRQSDPAEPSNLLPEHYNSRSTFAETLFRDRHGNPWRVRDYQRESLESHALRKVHCDGRDVGKTSEIEIVALWAALKRPNSEMLIATQCENHLYPLMDRIARRILDTPGLAVRLADLKRTPSWHVRFDTGFVIWGRIAGPNGINFQGLHVDWQIVDEAQEMTDNAWAEMYPALNTGGMRWVYGVPNGLRNTFYRMTQDPDAQQFNWPSRLNPDFTEEKDAEFARLYGGRTAPGYIHRVLGLHGQPAHGVFELDDYLACVDEALEFANIVIEGNDPFEAPVSVPKGEYYLGCDLGYARDPSELAVFRVDEPHFINVARVSLRGVHYHRQEEIIAALDRAYEFRRIGIDCGNNGRAVAHYLMARDETWRYKVHAIDFGATIDLGVLPDGRPDRVPVKEYMTDLLRRRMAERSLVFPRLPDRESQYAGHTYRINEFGRVLYEKGDDHIIDADRCALLARDHDVRNPPREPRPFKVFLDDGHYDDDWVGWDWR